jgi:hypothetical protein
MNRVAQMKVILRVTVKIEAPVVDFLGDRYFPILNFGK